MAKYYIKDFQEEHKNILAALDDLEKNLKLTTDNDEKINTIKKFFEDYFEYVQNHITREDMLYKYFEKKIEEQTMLDVLVTSKTVITEEVKKLKDLTGNNDSESILKTTKEFIENIKERISIEEDAIFSTADLYCFDGEFEI